MKKFIIFVMAIVLILGMVACDSNKATEIDHSQVVMAKIGVVESETKALTMYSNVEDASPVVVYKMTASPKWTTNDKAIVGRMSDETEVQIKSTTDKYLVKVNSDNTTSELYFSQGQWTITINCYYKVGTTEYLKYTGTKDVYFNVSNSAAHVVLGAISSTTKTGSIVFNSNTDSTSKITVVNAGNSDSLVVSIDGTAITGITSETTDNIITYTIPSNTSLTVGNHTVLVQVKQGETVVGGREFSFTLGEGETVYIYGTIDASQFINGKIDMGKNDNIDELKITFAGNATASTTTGTSVEIGPTVTLSTGAEATYQWYKDGVAINTDGTGTITTSGSKAAYTVPKSTVPGVYDFTCKVTATKDSVSITKSFNIRVTVNF